MVLNGGDWKAGKKSFHDGIRLMFTGCASPAYRMRRSASPEEDTMSYWPPPPFFMSATISSELPAYFALTWHPVCCSNGFTQSGSRYPSQAIRLSWPSPVPTFLSTGRLAVGTACPAVPDPCGVVPPVVLLVLPQPAAMTDAAVSASAADSGRKTRRRCSAIFAYPPQSAGPDRVPAEL